VLADPSLTPSALNKLMKFLLDVASLRWPIMSRLIVGFDATVRAKFTLALYSDPNTPSLKI